MRQITETYDNVPNLELLLAENTVKHHREKTIEERISEKSRAHLEHIARLHASLGEAHEAVEDNETMYSQWSMRDYLSYHDGVLIKLHGTTALGKDAGVEDLQAASKVTVSDNVKASELMLSSEPTLEAQLSMAWMAPGTHYHLKNITSAATHKQWLPVAQGVSRQRLGGVAFCVFADSVCIAHLQLYLVMVLLVALHIVGGRYVPHDYRASRGTG